MIDIPEKKEVILNFLESSGPSIPVRISKVIGMDPVFASAILSELLNEKKIKLSHMRLGSSPLYFLPGQEKKLEDHIDNLKSVEKEVFLKLKDSKILLDEEESPAYRIALRNLKDFSIRTQHQGKLAWEYAFSEKEKIEKKEALEDKKREIPKIEEKKVENIFSKSEKKTEIIDEIHDFLSKKDLKFVEGIQSDKKEVVAIVGAKTSLGNINFLLIAKNKKTTSKDEVSSAIQRSLHSKMPCLFLLRKEPPKSILTFLEENKNIIKLGIF